MITGAQSSIDRPLPEVTTFVRQAIQQQRVADSKEHDYVFQETVGGNKLRKECTWAPQCPAPFGTPGVVGVALQVLAYEEHNFEIFWLDGIRVARVLPNRAWNGMTDGAFNIPVSDTELAVENQRVDNEVAEAKKLLAQGRDPSSSDDPPQILFSRMLELCTFSNPRRQVVDHRSTILFDFAANPSENPVGANETLLKSFSGTLGIDEEDHAVQQVEGRFLADVKLDGGKIKIRKGTRITIRNRRVETGIWLLARLEAWGEARYFTFVLNGSANIFAGNYRKFHVTSRILPTLSEVPAESRKPSSH